MYDEGLVDEKVDPHKPTDVKSVSECIMLTLSLPRASEYLGTVLTLVVFVSQ